MFTHVSTEALVCALVLSEEGNLPRAGARLHTSKSNVSRKVKTLQKSWGVELFQRTLTGFELTEQGHSSIRDTFGDKRALFLKALELYSQENTAVIVAELQKPGSPLDNVRNALMQFATRKDLSSAGGCMGINAICEFGLQDGEVLQLRRGAATELRQSLLTNLKRAHMEGELSANVEIDALADFFEVTLAGMRVAAKAGMSPTALKRLAETAAQLFLPQ